MRAGGVDDDDPIWGPRGAPPPRPRRPNLVVVERDGASDGPSLADRATTAGLSRRHVEIPPIKCEAGAIDMIASVGEDALLRADAPIFQRGRVLMRPCRRELPSSDGRTVIAAGLTEIDQHGLIDYLNRAVQWLKYDGRSRGWVVCDPPPKVAQTILSRSGQWRLRSLAGVISTPTIRPDGSLLTAPGYDAATRLYHVADTGLKLPRITATRQAALTALAELDGLLAEFPFLTDVDKSVALSALITPVARGCMGAAPMHAFRSPTPGSGKSYVADLASVIATGRRCPVMSPADKPEEAEKRLSAMLLGGYPIISLDNQNGELGGDLLCQAIDLPLVQIRVFGTLDMQEVENRACIFANGNGLRIRGDMTRRTIMADLDSGEERPEHRQFSKNPVAEVEADRARYVAACLTIVQACWAAPDRPDVPPLASFEGWSRSVRAALIWLGRADPCASMEAARDSDPELDELRALITAWADVIGTGKKNTCTTADLCALADKHLETDFGVDRDQWQHPELRDALYAILHRSKGVTPALLAKVLLSRSGRIVQRKRISHAGLNRKNQKLWFIESLQP